MSESPTPKRPRGRPPLDPADKSVGINVKIPGRMYDRVYQQARAARVSVPEFVRYCIRRTDPDRTKTG